MDHLRPDPLSRILISHFVDESAAKAQRRARVSLLEGYTSIVVNTLLFAVKLLVGMLTGSIALLADAVHTLADSVTSIVVIVSAYVARRPADREHPFGHGRAELVAALVVSVLLGVAAFEFGKSSFMRIFEPSVDVVPWWAAVVVAFTALIKQWLSRFASTLASLIQSRALQADAWHHRSDVLATLLVVVAMLSVRIGFAWLDGVIGVAVSFVIAWAAYRIASESISPLLGEAPSAEELAEVEQLAKEIPGVRGVHDIIIHKYGERRVISLHVETAHDQSAESVHSLAERVQDHIAGDDHGTVTVHVDPVNLNHPNYARVRQILAELVCKQAGLESFHDLRIIGDEVNFSLLADVTISHALDRQSQRAIVDAATELVGAEFPEAKLVLHFDPQFAFAVPKR